MPASIVCPYQLTLCPSVHWLALRLAILALLAIAASTGFCNLLPYDLAAHTCSKHLGHINMVRSAAFYSYCMFALLVLFVPLHKLFASLGWTGQVSLYCIASSSSSCLYGDASASNTQLVPPSDSLLLLFCGYPGPCPLAASFVPFLLYLLSALPPAALLYLQAWRA